MGSVDFRLSLHRCGQVRGRSTLDATPVAPLRPPLKGAAARLAALGPAGLPLTAELRFASWQ